MMRNDQTIHLLLQARQQKGLTDLARRQVARHLARLSPADLEDIALHANWPLDGLKRLLEPAPYARGKVPATGRD
jgi:hypothetical protein